jgi:ribosome-associated protein
MLFISPRISIPEQEFSFQFARSSGPGGQNVNKVNTKAQLRWNVANSPSLPPAVKSRFVERYSNRLTSEGEFVIASQRHRSQEQNIADCKEKLRQLILDVLKPPTTRKKTAPTRGSIRRRLQDKKGLSQKKQQRRPPRLDD